MRVLVTGGAGFIGSHLVRAALAAGESVRVLDDLSTGHRENLADVAADVELIEGSVVDPAAVAKAVHACEVVYHQAAIASVPRSVEDPVGSHAVNATGTLHVLEAARAADVRRVVFAASSAVYGDGEEQPKREDMKPRPLSPYALQKLAGEIYCEQYTRLLGLEAVALRYFNVYGPRQDPASMYAGVIPVFVTALVKGATLRVHGDGLQSRDFVHVSDVVAANRAAASAPSAAGDVFNVGRGEQVTILELLAQIARTMALEPVAPVHEPSRAGDVRHSLADVSRAAERLSWRAQTSLADGLVDTVAWYREHPRPMAGPRGSG